MMRTSYDPEVDAMFVWFGPGGQSAEMRRWRPAWCSTSTKAAESSASRLRRAGAAESRRRPGGAVSGGFGGTIARLHRVDRAMSIVLEEARIADLCRRFNVRRLDLFGSGLTGRFDPGHSDLDLLVEFAPMSPSRLCRGLLRARGSPRIRVRQADRLGDRGGAGELVADPSHRRGEAAALPVARRFTSSTAIRRSRET